MQQQLFEHFQSQTSTFSLVSWSMIVSTFIDKADPLIPTMCGEDSKLWPHMVLTSKKCIVFQILFGAFV